MESRQIRTADRSNLPERWWCACAHGPVPCILVMMWIGLVAAAPVHAQTATSTTGVVQGTITDISGGVLPGVTVVLTDLNTNTSRETISGESGVYSFVSVLPGRYKVTATLQGFQQTVVPQVLVEVNKTQHVDLKLGVGQLSETVEVVAGAAVVLQHNDSTIVNTLNEETVLRLPNPTRSIEAIQFNQPLAVPYMGGDSNRTRAGAIAGARTDQNTYTLDGADVSDNVVGDNFLEALPAAVVPLPAESVEEFSAATTNANATFGRGSGGQFVIVTKRGTNQFRGSSYFYAQNDKLNANSWNRSRLGLGKAPLENNRGGFSLGGPLVRNRTFFFTNYEAQRFPRTTEVARIVPTDTLRAGVLRFRDAAGNIVSYDLRAFDPRGIGLNPVVSSLWGTLPAGNDPSRGDGLNTVGFTGDADTSFKSDTAILRLDHNFSNTWRTDANYRFGSIREVGAAQADIGGVLRGNVKGTPVGTEDLPREPRFGAFGLTGQVSPNFLNETRASFLRGFIAFTRIDPFAQVPGANMALDIGGVDEPLDVSQTNARSQISDAHTYQVINNSTWMHDKHTVLFGATWRREYWFFQRNEQLAGSLTAPVAQVTAGTNVSIPATLRPPTCGAGVTTNCLTAADVNRFTQLYAGMLGLVDSVSVLGMRAPDLSPLPAGTPQDLNTRTDGYEFYVNDTWRMRSNLTLNLGLNYQFRLSPKEKLDRYAFLIDAQTKEVLTSDIYLDRARKAAEAGQPYNPTLAFLPLSASGRDKYYDTDWSNLGPRLAVTWTPEREHGWLSSLMRRDKTVLRGGYGLVFDRVNSVQQILALGMGYGENLTLNAPRCNANGTPGPGCAPGGAADPASVLRVGVDGPVPLPARSVATVPIVPNGINVTTFADPRIKIGRTHSFNLSYQRELPAKFVMETGYVLRIGRQLPQAWVLSSVPYFHRDSSSGQTFAQAYDAIAQQLRSGVPASSVSPQPWLENQLGAGQTALVASQQATSFIDGNLSALWLQVNNRRIALGQQPLSNQQIQTLWARGDGGKSLYNGWFVSARRRSASGLTMSASYTLSSAMDEGGRRQNSTGAQSSGFDPHVDWGPADFDRRHVFNLTGVYDLPFGKTGRLERITGGWYVAGIFSASSGVPLDVCQRTGVFGGGLAFTGCVGAIPAGDTPATTVSRNNAGAGGVGTTGNPATGGTGLNLFDDPQAVFNNYRRVLVSEDPRAGRGTLRGLPRWNLDMSFGKRTRVSHAVNAVFTAEIVNVFNSLQFSNPALNLATPANFGVITAQANTPRQIQLGLRVEF